MTTSLPSNLTLTFWNDKYSISEFTFFKKMALLFLPKPAKICAHATRGLTRPTASLGLPAIELCAQQGWTGFAILFLTRGRGWATRSSQSDAAHFNVNASQLNQGDTSYINNLGREGSLFKKTFYFSFKVSPSALSDDVPPTPLRVYIINQEDSSYVNSPPWLRC